VHHVRWSSTEEMVSTAERELQRRGEIRAGDVLGVVAGTRLSSGSTNFMRLHNVVRTEPNNSATGRKQK